MMKFSMPISNSLKLKSIALECDSENYKEVEIYFDVLPIQNVDDIGLIKPIARATLLLASPHEGSINFYITFSIMEGEIGNWG
jgi:hypothetical protein